MPKSKAAESSTPKSKQMKTVKDSTVDSPADMGATGVFTRSRARRLSLSVPEHISPPKRPRRNSLLMKATGTPINLDESKKQDAKDTPAYPDVGEVNEEILSNANEGDMSQSSSVSKKRKSKKLNECESPLTEVQVSDSTKKAKNSRKSCEGAVPDSVFTGRKSAKMEKARKSMIMEKIQEDETKEDVQEVADNVKVSSFEGISDQDHQIVNSGNETDEEKSIEPTEKLRRKSTQKSTPGKQNNSLVEHEVTPLIAPKKSLTPAKLSSKKSASPLTIAKTPQSVGSSSIEKLDETPKHLQTAVIEKQGKTPQSVSKKSAKVSAEKPEVQSAIEKTPKAVRLPSNDNLDGTPLPVSKKSGGSAKLSAKKINVETAIESTPKGVESPSIDNTPVQVSKKSGGSAKLSGKKTALESTKEKTPRAAEPPSNDNIDMTPEPVSKKSVSAAKLSAKKINIETATENTPKGVGSSSIDNTPVQASKKLKHSAKKAGLEDESSTPNTAQLPQSDDITKTPQPISKKLESTSKLPAKKSFSKDERTPNKIDTLTEETVSKTPASVLKKPPSPVKLSAKKAVIEDDTDSDVDSDAESRKEIMRSAEKRIIRNLSTSESESRNHVKVLQLPVVDVKADQQMDTSGDSDSAPEDVTFDASRQSALELLKQTVDSIKRDKQKKKEKRKEMLEIWRQRKEENLIRLKESKANRDDASCSSSEESLHERNGYLKAGSIPQGKKTCLEDDSSKPSLKRLPADIVDSLPNHLPKVPKMAPTQNPVEKLKMDKGKKQKAGANGEVPMRSGNPSAPNLKADVDFKPLPGGGKTTFGVVSLGEPTLKTVSHIAANFKQDLLYGHRICRVPTSTLAHNRKKLQVNMK